MDAFGYETEINDNDILNEEQRNLDGCIKDIDQKLESLQRRITDYKEEQEQYRGDYEFLHAFKDAKKWHDEYSNQYENLKMVSDNPYFGHLNLTENKVENNDLFIGEKTIINNKGDYIVYDWRSDVCSIFYTNLKNYKHNEYEYDVNYKRNISIFDRSVIDCIEEYNAKEKNNGIENTFLKKILLEKKNIEGFTDIIKTIQSNQNDIIRTNIKNNILCQGIAGSGKTVIIVHRLSYLLFNNKNIQPTEFLFIAPNDNFKNNLNNLNVKLGIDKIKIVTLYDYYKDKFNTIFNQSCQKKINIGKIVDDENIDLNEHYSKEALDKKYEIIEKDFVESFSKIKEKYNINYDDKELSNLDKCKKFYFYLQNRIKTYNDNLSSITKELRSICANKWLNIDDGSIDRYSMLNNITKQNNGFFANLFPDKELRAKKKIAMILQLFCDNVNDLPKYLTDEILIKKVNSSLDNLIIFINRNNNFVHETDVQNTIKSINEFNKQFEILKSINVNEDIKNSSYLYNLMVPRNIILNCFEKICVGKYVFNTVFSHKDYYRVDIFTILYILLKLGYKKYAEYKYIYIDEAQDYNDVELNFINNIEKESVLNIFGDYNQNISKNSIPRKNWDSLKQLLDKDFKYYELNENYRNTLEIVDYCNKELDLKMLGVGVNGPQVNIKKFVNLVEINNQSIKDGSIIITNNQEYLNYLMSNGNSNAYSISSVKGLEFKNVIVIDDGLSNNEKYVAFTRSLLNLDIYIKE